MNLSPEHRTSMVIAFDGESKCGKTTFTKEVALGAQYQKDLYSGLFLSDVLREGLRTDGALDYFEQVGFDTISTISAGNIFRAAAHYTKVAEGGGKIIKAFSQTDAPLLRSMLDEEGMIDFLQNDDAVGKHVSEVAQFAGVQALCGVLFCEDIQRSYFENSGHNLVIVDARDPVGHMTRNNLLGTSKGKILPLSVLSVYIETPTHVAASRLKGSLEDNTKVVAERRLADATRAELPVVAPNNTTPIREWSSTIPFWDGVSISSLGEPLSTLHITNGEERSLEYIKYVGDVLAEAATMTAYAIDSHLKIPIPHQQFSPF